MSDCRRYWRCNYCSGGVGSGEKPIRRHLLRAPKRLDLWEKADIGDHWNSPCITSGLTKPSCEDSDGSQLTDDELKLALSSKPDQRTRRV
jgi:hypothetical protein